MQFIFSKGPRILAKTLLSSPSRKSRRTKRRSPHHRSNPRRTNTQRLKSVVSHRSGAAGSRRQHFTTGNDSYKHHQRRNEMLPVVDFDEYGDIRTTKSTEDPMRQHLQRDSLSPAMVSSKTSTNRPSLTNSLIASSKGSTTTRSSASITAMQSKWRRFLHLKHKCGVCQINFYQSKCLTLQPTVAVTRRFLLSHIGLGCLVLVYVVIGGLLFDAVESTNEIRVKQRQQRNRERLIKSLLDDADALFNQYLNGSFEIKYKHWRDFQRRRNFDESWHVNINKDEWFEKAKHRLAVYEHEETVAGYKDTKDQEEKQEEVWTITSAMLYSATVITTIGYGNITPKTVEGKILTIVYALFGIPLMFICLTNTGDLLANVFIDTYSKIVNLFCVTCCSERFRRLVGFSVENVNEKSLSADYSGGFHGQQQKQEKKHVPIIASLGALAAYIFGGAILFGAWEQWHVVRCEWLFSQVGRVVNAITTDVDGAYFCFITFTTIGFGDFVPGQGTLSEDKAGKMVLCAIFLLVGMIVMAMCFKLMQDELVSKARALAKNLGIIDSEDDENIEDRSYYSSDQASADTIEHRPADKKATEERPPLLRIFRSPFGRSEKDESNGERVNKHKMSV